MPGNLQAASPVDVMPQTLSTAFTEVRAFPNLSQVYHDGTTERSLIVDGVNNPVSLRNWKLSKRLTVDQLTTLRTFYEAHFGGLIPFFWYDPFEPADGMPIGSNFDPTGDSEQGRHICRFTNQQWTQTTGLARTDTAIEFQEIA
jgi:phage-related protein